MTASENHEGMAKADGRPLNYAVVCGQMRDELEFRVTLAALLAERESGVMDGIILSTWKGEIDKIPGLREELEQYGIGIVESVAPTLVSSGNTLAQNKALYNGLKQVPDGAAVLKLRTDRTTSAVRQFRPQLEVGPLPALSFGALGPVFSRRVAAFAVVATACFYASDFSYYGMKEDLLQMAHFDSRYDALYRGFGAEHRLWTQPFLLKHPRLTDLFENTNVMGISTWAIRAAKEGKPIPDAILRLLTFTWITIRNNFEIIDRRASYEDDISVAGVLGAAPTSGIRPGTVASHFTVSITCINSQEALEHLVSGELPVETELDRQFAALMDDFRARGDVALPTWTPEVKRDLLAMQEDNSAELVIQHSTYTSPHQSEVPVVADAIISDERLAVVIQRELGVVQIPAEHMPGIVEVLGTVRRGVQGVHLYLEIASNLMKHKPWDQKLAHMIGFFLSRAADRGNTEAAALFAWLAFDGAIGDFKRELAVKWARTAATKENPLGQYVFARMLEAGWVPPGERHSAAHWDARAAENGFTPELLAY
ncbi:MAG: hypothetical protein EP335_09825 [Alphaproteobacteria bacterium]|nr:MAG: hypothetical protein EP335_09825 [Alphaproteobacteria bacterium]